MTGSGPQAAVRASLILLGAAVVRLATVPPPAEAPTLAGRASVGDSLAAAADSLAAEQERRSRPLEEGETVDVNRAPAADLDRLPGIGPARAARIVADRTANGPFRSLEDLTRVPGLGSRSLAQLKPHLDLPSSLGDRGVAPAKGQSQGRRLLGVVNRPGMAAGAGTIHLNSATREQLESLPGIGPVLAGRIIEQRDQRGGFSSLADLIEVPGVGPATLARLRTRLSVP